MWIMSNGSNNGSNMIYVSNLGKMNIMSKITWGKKTCIP